MASRFRASLTIFGVAVCVFVCGGCSDAVQLVRDTGHGGVVTYSYKLDRGGHLVSPYRKQALELITSKCGGDSRIVREGEARGYTSAGMGIVEGTEDEERGRRWAIQFECKTQQQREGPDEKLMSRQDEMREQHNKVIHHGWVTSHHKGGA